MLANLIQLIAPKSSAADSAYELAFVREVTVRRRPPRSRRLEQVMFWSWIAILVKCWVVIWAIAKYHVPIDPAWVTVPTVIFALVCTAVYYWRR